MKSFKSIRLLTLAILLISPFVQAAQESTILFDEKQKAVNSTTKPVRWKIGDNRISIPFKSKSHHGIKSIDLSAGHPNCIEFRAIYYNGMKPGIFIDWTKARGSIDEQIGELVDGCFIDIALYDFDSDGTPEIILSVGDGSIEQVVYVVKYHPPLRVEDRLRSENWTWDVFEGQSQCFISKDSISFKFGSRGFDDSYFSKNGRFYRK